MENNRYSEKFLDLACALRSERCYKQTDRKKNDNISINHQVLLWGERKKSDVLNYIIFDTWYFSQFSGNFNQGFYHVLFFVCIVPFPRENRIVPWLYGRYTHRKENMRKKGLPDKKKHEKFRSSALHAEPEEHKSFQIQMQ